MLFRRKPSQPSERPTKLSPRERVWRTLQHQPIDRVPCADVYFLPETLHQWMREGFPLDKSPAEFFDLDLVCIPVDCTMGWREQVLDETDDYRIVTGADGVTRKEWKVYHTAPQELDFPVKEPRDWRNLRPALHAHEGRLPEGWEEQIARARSQSRFIALAFLEPCTLARRLLGSRQWVEALQAPSPWLDEMLETGVRLILDTVDLALKRLTASAKASGEHPLDGVWLHGELAYTHGAFMTDNAYRQVVLPYHRQLTSELHRRGLAVFLYSPGNLLPFLRFVRKSGFDAILPLETNSQNDLATCKRAYGHLVALGGNISTDRLMESDAAAEWEVRWKVAVGTGETFTGYLFCLDRPVPPMVPLQRYQRVLNIVRQFAPPDFRLCSPSQ